ncbi:MAG: hypothetical protein WC587_03680 [Candidatus Paceibacterota bacterium]
MNIESMENPNLEIKKFTKENPCECGYPNVVDLHQENCIHYEKEGKEFGDAGTEAEEKKLSDEEYAKELKSRRQIVEDLPAEIEEPEDLWAKEAEEMFKKEKKEEKPLPPLPERLQIAVNIINDKLRRKISAAAGGETAVRISGDYERNWVEKNLLRIFNEVVEEIRIPQDQYEILKRVKVPKSAQGILDKFIQNWLEERKNSSLF